MSDVPCPKCNRHPGRGPVGVAVDGNGRTTVCRECNGRGWIKSQDDPVGDAIREGLADVERWKAQL